MKETLVLKRVFFFLFFSKKNILFISKLFGKNIKKSHKLSVIYDLAQ